MSRMTPDRWRVVQALFDEVVELSDEERASLLRARCAGDPTLRQEVEALLASSARAARMFEAAPVQVARALFAESAASRDDVQPGQIIGAYRIGRLLGRGGMGAVYLAERADGHFQKQVALKIVKRGMDTDEILARFRREREILARLQHPNIADLYDGGVTPNGLPYFVMELAAGEPIDRWCDARRCSVDGRLDLFITVCEAVQYAHRNLIVHRDLKPSNILVCEGNPKLLDFGIAKLVAEDGQDGSSQITQTFARRLTPEYAAPEQLAGDATTTATDVYALGVVLYELLTGRLPNETPPGPQAGLPRVTDPKPPSALVARLRGEAADAELDRVADARGTVPEALRQRLAGDLDAIALMALQEEPERRYATAAALADDLRRHLSGEPVAARPDTQLYRWSKFVRRNRKTVSLAAAAVLALSLGMVGTGWQAREATRARDAQQQAAERANEEAERALAARDFVVRMFENQDPEDLEGRTTFTRDELIGWGFDNLESLRDKPLLYASVMNTLGQITFSMGDRARADSLFRRAYGILRPLGDEPDVAVSMMGMGEVHRRDLKFADAVQWFRRALALRRRILPQGHPDIARTMQALAFALYNMDTEESLAEAERLYNELLALHPERGETRAAALEGLADLRLQTGNAESAVDLYGQAIATRAGVVRNEHPQNARTRWGMAAALTQLGRGAEAEKAYRDALSSLMLTYGSDHPDVAFAHYYLGHFLFSQRRYADAEAELLAAAEISARVNPVGHGYTAQAWLGLGMAHFEQQDYGEAADAFREALRVGLSAQGETADPRAREAVPTARLWLGLTLVEVDRPADALPHLRTAFAAWREEPAAAVDAARCATALAAAFRRLGQPDSAAFYATRGRAG